MKNTIKTLTNASGKEFRKIIKKQAELYENAVLSSSIFPHECFNIIIEILSNSDIFQKNGIEIFISKIYTDIDKLSEEQRQTLLNVIRENYSQYKNIKLCWHLGDLIARRYDPEQALTALQEALKTCTEEGKEGVILGLSVLQKNNTENLKIKRNVEQVFADEKIHITQKNSRNTSPEK